MPTYNRDFIIELAIKSIIHQFSHESEIELLIGDDGNDKTENIVNSIENKNSNLTIYYEKMDRLPLSDKLNYLINKSTGDYYGIVGSDDFQSPFKINSFEKALSDKKGDVFGQYQFIYHDLIFGHSKLWTQNRDLGFFKAGSFLIMDRYIFDTYNGYTPGLWRSIDSSLAEKINWSKITCVNVEIYEPRIVHSSIAIQHIDNIWGRSKKGFFRRRKQTVNYLTETIDLDMKEQMGSVYPVYKKIKSTIIKKLKWNQKISLYITK